MLPCKQWAGLRAEGERNSRAHVPGLLVCARALSCLTLRPVGCSPQGSPVHGRFQVRILDWAAISHSRGFSWPGDRSCVSLSPSPSLSRRGSRGGCVHGCDRANWDAPPPARFLGPLPSLPVSTICRTVLPTVLHSPGEWQVVCSCYGKHAVRPNSGRHSALDPHFLVWTPGAHLILGLNVREEPQSELWSDLGFYLLPHIPSSLYFVYTWEAGPWVIELFLSLLCVFVNGGKMCRETEMHIYWPSTVCQSLVFTN